MALAPRSLIAAVVAAAALAAAPAAALADCPGASAQVCPYTTASQVGQRDGGVLRFPQAVAVGPDGSIYVGDQGSHVVQVFAPTGQFVRAIGQAGNRDGQLSGVGAVAVAADGTTLIADGGDRIERFDANGGFLGAFGHSGSTPGAFHFGAGSGNGAGAGGGLAIGGDVVYVADTANNRIQRFALDGSQGAVIVPPGTLARPQGIAVRATRVAVADDQHHRIVVYDTGGKQLTTVGTGPGPMPGQLANPYDVALDPAGRLFVADDLNQRVVRFGSKPAYPYKARWGSYGTGPGQLAYPRGIATDATGHVYVANTGDDRIDVFDINGALLSSFGASGRSSGQFNDPAGVGADASGVRAVTDSVNGRVELLNPDGTVATVWGSPAPGPTILPEPVAVAFDPAGNALVLDRHRGRIVAFSRASGLPVSTIGSQGSGPGQLQDPSALAIDASGGLWVGDTGNGRIAHFAPTGDYLGSITGAGAVRGVAVTPDATSVYAATSDNRITRYSTADGSVLNTFGGTGTQLGKLTAPAQITLDVAGDLWVADRGNNRVQEFGPTGQRLGFFGQRGTAPGQFIHPTSVSVDCLGTLTVTDSDNNRVQQFALASPPAPPAPPPVPVLPIDPTAPIPPVAAVSPCAVLGPLGTPPPPKLPVLPTPVGPQLTARPLRKGGVLRFRGLAIRVGCDTACTVTTTVTLTPRATPPKHKRRVTVRLPAVTTQLSAGQTKIARPALSRKQVKVLRRALRRLHGLSAVVQVSARSGDGTSTDSTLSLRMNAD